MKRFATLFSALSLIGSAVTAAPVSLPRGPIYVNFSTDEQYSKTNDIANALNPARSGGTAGNWGIVEVESIRVGQALAPPGSQIDPLGPTIFSNTVGGQQILGIFFRVQNNPGFPATSTGGALDLYSFESSNQVIGNEFVNANLSKRSGIDGSQYTGFTCLPNTPGCTFLARFLFSAGADVNSQTHAIFTPLGSSDFESYLKVDTATPGEWTRALDSDYFSLNPNNQPCGAPGVSCTSANDLRADGSFTQTGASAWDIAGTDIIGLAKRGAFRAFVVPEPSSLSMACLGIFAIGVFGLRRRSGIPFTNH